VLEWYFWSFAAIVVVTSGAYSRDRFETPRLEATAGPAMGT
jgi:hypothetical protein